MLINFYFMKIYTHAKLKINLPITYDAKNFLIWQSFIIHLLPNLGPGLARTAGAGLAGNNTGRGPGQPPGTGSTPGLSELRVDKSCKKDQQKTLL